MSHLLLAMRSANDSQEIGKPSIAGMLPAGAAIQWQASTIKVCFFQFIITARMFFATQW
jgi:hypothetical protein